MKRGGELQVEEIRVPYTDASSATLEIGLGPPTKCASEEVLKRDTSVKIDGGVSCFRIIVDEDVLAFAIVRRITSVAAHGEFRRLRRGHLYGGKYLNRA